MTIRKPTEEAIQRALTLKSRERVLIEAAIKWYKCDLSAEALAVAVEKLLEVRPEEDK